MNEMNQVRVNGFELHYEMDGDGEPLLLLHGMTGCSQDWQHAGRHELARHFRLVMPDARGHGRSTNPSGLFSHRQCARDVLELLDALELPRCRAIGVSMGGNTLLHLASSCAGAPRGDGARERGPVLPRAGAEADARGAVRESA